MQVSVTDPPVSDQLPPDTGGMALWLHQVLSGLWLPGLSLGTALSSQKSLHECWHGNRREWCSPGLPPDLLVHTADPNMQQPLCLSPWPGWDTLCPNVMPCNTVRRRVSSGAPFLTLGQHVPLRPSALLR